MLYKSKFINKSYEYLKISIFYAIQYGDEYNPNTNELSLKNALKFEFITLIKSLQLYRIKNLVISVII